MAKDKPNKSAKNSMQKFSKHESNKIHNTDDAAPIFQDERFQHLVQDPRFRSLPKKQRKVKIDKRFQSMFTDKKFHVKYTVDKYGRKVDTSNAEDLKKYYELDSNASDSQSDTDEKQPASEVDEAEQEQQEIRAEEKAISKDTDKDVSDEAEQASDLDESDEEEDLTPKNLRKKMVDPNVDYARGEARMLTDSSSGEESSDDEAGDPMLNIDHVWGELHQEAETTDDSTRRLAVCNMDWDRIRAVDMMVLFTSFLPMGGSILSVKIYPSDFGKERMAEEEAHGPPELVGLGKSSEKKNSADNNDNAADSSDDDADSDDELVKEQDSEAEEGDDYHMEKLRQYQLNRLRYYYAVVECDSVATADKIYAECDGIEYESSATKVDLRFIPDDTNFDEDTPSDVCTELPDTNAYKPRQFTTTALQQAKVDLTWDETAVDRKELGDKLSSGKLNDISDKDLRKIVNYSSEEEAEFQEEASASEPELNTKAAAEQDKSVEQKSKTKNKKADAINKYKALLAEINEKEQQEKKHKYEMEYSWNVNDHPNQNEPAAEEEIKPKAELTPIEKVMQKRSEKNKKRKEERKKKKLQAQGIDANAVNSDSDNDFIPDGIDMSDAYFAEEFANGDFDDDKQNKKLGKKAQKKQKQLERVQQEQQAAKESRELELLLDDDDEAEQGKQHFSLEKIMKSEQGNTKKKRRKQLKKSKSSIAQERKEVEDNFQINLDDSRFKAVFDSPQFNIDPTDSHFKRTKAMETIIHEKLKRRHGSDGQNGKPNAASEQNDEADSAKRPKKQLENTLLVKSIKRKIQMKQQK